VGRGNEILGPIKIGIISYNVDVGQQEYEMRTLSKMVTFEKYNNLCIIK